MTVVCQALVATSFSVAPFAARAQCATDQIIDDFGWGEWEEALDGGGSPDDGDEGDGGGSGASTYDDWRRRCLPNKDPYECDPNLPGDWIDGSAGGVQTSIGNLMQEAIRLKETDPFTSAPRFEWGNLAKAKPLSASTELGSANRRIQATDYAAAGPAPLVWARSYNSNATVSSAQTRVQLGAGWRTYWDRSLQVLSSTSVRLHRANGRTIDFSWNGSAWVSPAATGGTLTAITGGWQYINTRDGVETYSSAGRLASMGQRGLITTLQYDGSGRLTTIANPFGRTLAIGYDGASRVSTVSLPGGITLGYSYDASGRLASRRQTDNSTRQYLYENATYSGLLTGVVDESGRRVATWNYDTSGRPNGSAIGSNVAPVSISYSGSLVTTTDARGTQRERALSTIGPRKVATRHTAAATADSSALNVTAAYDSTGRPQTLNLPSGETITRTNDARGRPIVLTRAVGTAQQITANITWHPTWRKPTRIVVAGVTRDYAIDSVGRVTQITETAGGVTRTIETRVYNAQNLLQSITDRRGSSWSFSYDAAGNLTSITDPTGRVALRQSFDVHGNPWRVVRADGAVVDRTFDTRRRLVSRTEAGGDVPKSVERVS